jgi:hypothetical protein
MTDPARQDPVQRALEGGLSRMSLWLIFAVLSLVIVYWLAPQMVKVSLYKLSLLPAAVYVLYWIDRALQERRPHLYFEDADGLEDEALKYPPGTAEWSALMGQAAGLRAEGRDRYMRRTILISFGMVAVALGS